MMTVGIYGRIGSGKSEVARMFAELGAAVISADRIGRDVVDQDRSVLQALVDAFGESIIDSEGHLIRRELGRIAFSSPESRAKLDSIVHPPLLERLRAEISDHQASSLHSVVVVDAALILNWGLERELDVLVCVTAPEESIIRRLANSGLSEREAKGRLNSQLPVESQVSRADYVIENDGGIEKLRREAARVFDRIARREKSD
jgi:dephospho-CoA kinase